MEIIIIVLNINIYHLYRVWGMCLCLYYTPSHWQLFFSETEFSDIKLSLTVILAKQQHAQAT